MKSVLMCMYDESDYGVKESRITWPQVNVHVVHAGQTVDMVPSTMDLFLSTHSCCGKVEVKMGAVVPRK